MLAISICGCSSPATKGSSEPGPSVSVGSTSAASGVPSSPSSRAAPASAESSSGHLTSLEVCERVVSAKIGSACQHMPPDAHGADASQFTMTGAPPRREVFGAAFTYGTAHDFEAALVDAKKAEVGKNRAPPLVLSNEKALTVVVADGELRASDSEALKKIVDALP